MPLLYNSNFTNIKVLPVTYNDIYKINILKIMIQISNTIITCINGHLSEADTSNKASSTKTNLSSLPSEILTKILIYSLYNGFNELYKPKPTPTNFHYAYKNLTGLSKTNQNFREIYKTLQSTYPNNLILQPKEIKELEEVLQRNDNIFKTMTENAQSMINLMHTQCTIPVFILSPFAVGFHQMNPLSDEINEYIRKLRGKNDKLLLSMEITSRLIYRGGKKLEESMPQLQNYIE